MLQWGQKPKKMDLKRPSLDWPNKLPFIENVLQCKNVLIDLYIDTVEATLCNNLGPDQKL